MIAAVDIGGTKTLVAVFDAHGKVIEQLKFPTAKNYEQFKVDLADIVAKLTTKDFLRVVVAIPGLVNRRKGIGVAFGNLPWSNVPVGHDLEILFKAPVVVENDAKLAGLSEAILLKASYNRVLYVTIGTGIGAAYIKNGVIAPDFIDSEPGHMLLEHKDRLARWEDFASGSAISEKFGKKASEITDAQSWYIIARNIALGLINLIAILTPEVIIIGGGVGKHFNKFKDRLDEEMKIFENPMLKLPVILQAKQAEEAVIYGCYEYAKQHAARHIAK